MGFLEGLSPRVRGNPDAAENGPGCGGSIPACAGEPTSGACTGCRSRVYPRVCGGTRRRGRRRPGRPGLSPRVRGNPGGAFRNALLGRSIPACAGEPHGEFASGRSGWVYPRVCGGTAEAYYNPDAVPGLSPRVRGNLIGGDVVDGQRRSIPACAGEPRTGVIAMRRGRVYPRVCGGTHVKITTASAGPGLSPRVRGNPIFQDDFVPSWRSIPACAGEPSARRPAPGRRRVYPRVCGGTVRGPMMLAMLAGLSPRVRGNHSERHNRCQGYRSIPAGLSHMDFGELGQDADEIAIVPTRPLQLAAH